MSKFEALLENFQSDKKIRIGIVNAADEAAIKAVFHPKIRKFLKPVLIGDEAAIRGILSKLNESAEIIPAATDEECAQIGVKLAKDKQIDFLMKGHLSTRTFLRAVVNKEHGISGGRLLGHIVLDDVPAYHKLLLTTDGGMVLKPDKEEKKQLIAYSIEVMNKIGVAKPKVALLAASESVNPKVPSSVEAEEIMREIQAEAPESCDIDGPISLDLAVSKEIARQKEYDSAVAGDADILVGPDITTMNVLGKSLTVLAGGEMAGIIMGAEVPIVMVSRASTENEKMYAILMAMYCSKED